MSIKVLNTNVGVLQKMLCNTPELESANKQINKLKKNNSKTLPKNINTLFYELDVAVIFVQHAYKYVYRTYDFSPELYIDIIGDEIRLLRNSYSSPNIPRQNNSKLFRL
jgi:hypothetical protein